MTADWIKINSISWLFILAICLISSSTESFISGSEELLSPLKENGIILVDIFGES